MSSAVQTGGLWATSTRALDTISDGEHSGRAWAAAACDAVAAHWGQSWGRLRTECPDIEDRWTTIERCPSVARTMAAAGRQAGRCQRGPGDLSELETRLRAWEAAVLRALSAQDQAKSERLCGDCGAEDVSTVLPKLTGSRVCSRCLREARP